MSRIKVEKHILLLAVTNASLYADDGLLGAPTHGFLLTTIAASFVIMGLIDLKHGAFRVGLILIGTAIAVRVL
jgi:hypothetical protein